VRCRLDDLREIEFLTVAVAGYQYVRTLWFARFVSAHCADRTIVQFDLSADGIDTDCMDELIDQCRIKARVSPGVEIAQGIMARTCARITSILCHRIESVGNRCDASVQGNL